MWYLLTFIINSKDKLRISEKLLKLCTSKTIKQKILKAQFIKVKYNL